MPEETKKTKEIIVSEEKENPTMPLIQMAIEKGANIEALEKLMDLQERWEASKARKAYNEAMAGFQSECPVIKRKKRGGETDSGKVAYYYAELGTIVDQVRPLLGKYNLSYSFKTTITAGKTFVTCIPKHILGHSEETTVEMPSARKTSVMSDPQVAGATITYGKRYAFCNAFGIMTEGEDIDAQEKSNQGARPKKTVEEVLAKIRATKKPEDFKQWRDWIPGSGYNQTQQNVMLRVLEETVKDVKN